MKINSLLFLFLLTVSCSQPENRIDLTGKWQFTTDSTNWSGSILLPGSMTSNGLGEDININTPWTGSINDDSYFKNEHYAKYRNSDNIKIPFWLQPVKYYKGVAWYRKEVNIPTDWNQQDISLFLERCHWETRLWVDDKEIGMQNTLGTPHQYDLSEVLTPGKHTLTLRIDNRIKDIDPGENSHSISDHTQGNWNGVIGDMYLQVRPQVSIVHTDIYPDINAKNIRVKTYLKNKKKTKATAILTLKANGKSIQQEIVLLPGENKTETILSLGDNICLWDEFNPNLYTLEASLTDKEKTTTDTHTEQFGMRDFRVTDRHITINGRPVFLRGTLDCAAFPKTGYPPTDQASWEKIFTACRNHGLNHIRFHSWCPPQAAFHAADRLGLYLQVELPMWIKDVGKYPARRQFFEEEMYAILNEYGNHPSFILKCNGNENEGNFDVLEDLIIKGQQYDNRHLYSASTARTHVKADQFYVSHLTHKGWITVYEGKPSTDWDRNAESDIDVPVIAHETGQRCMYPNFAEISKYTGVLEARNFNVYRERLARNGMLHQADDFFRATGAHTVLQYKEVNESLLRTSKSGGFQLLGLSDFPGQGSAFVGILDAFWEDKGLVSPEKFRESCAPTVLLARMPKRVYNENETFTAQLGIYHFGNKDIKRGKVNWALTDEAGRELKKGNLSHQAIQSYTVTDSLAKIDIPLEDIKSAGKYTLHVALGACHNEWDIWVYPSKTEANEEHLSFTESWETARKMLSEGKQVLFVPQSAQGRKTQFASHFWNPIMFNWDPMIVGTLIEHTHPSMADFPTSYYADWQWWDILNYGTAIDLTALSSVTPIIQSIDTYEENRKLGIAFEVKSGKGKLFVLCADIHKDIDKRPAMKQLMYSIKNYVGSDRFQPQNEVPTYMLDALFDTHVQKKKKDNSSDAINQLLNK